MAEAKSETTAKKPTAAKPASKAKATAAKTPAAKKPVARKPAAPKAARSAAKTPSAEERYKMIEVAAYFIAERNSFEGSPVDYWTQAEIQISKLLGK